MKQPEGKTLMEVFAPDVVDEAIRRVEDTFVGPGSLGSLGFDPSKGYLRELSQAVLVCLKEIKALKEKMR